MRALTPVLLIFFLVSQLVLLNAQSPENTAGINGYIVDENGMKIPGVVVTLSSDILVHPRTAVTNENGRYMFPALIPGTYKLIFELEGFKRVVRKNIRLKAGETRTVIAMMKPEKYDHGFILPCTIPLIDIMKHHWERYLAMDFMESLPTSRDVQGLVTTFPGVLEEQSQTGSPGFTWNVNSLDVTVTPGFTAHPANYNIAAIEEIQVTTEGGDIRRQSSGPHVNIVTGRGGNQIQGELLLYSHIPALQFKQTPAQEITKSYRYGMRLGGHFIKDRLWWFGALDARNFAKQTSEDRQSASKWVSGYGNLLFQINRRTQAEIRAHSTRGNQNGLARLSPLQQDNASLTDLEETHNLVSGNLYHLLSENFFVILRGAYTRSENTRTARGSAVNQQTGHNEGNDMKVVDGWARIEGSAPNGAVNRKSLSTSLEGTFFIDEILGLGHAVRFGADYLRSENLDHTLLPNQRILHINRNTPAPGFIALTPDYFANVTFKRLSAYIDDTVYTKRLTAIIGIRFDRETGGVNPVTQPGFSWLQPGSPYHGTNLLGSGANDLDISAQNVPVVRRMVSPRISAAYDFTGDSRNVLKLSFGRYMTPGDPRIASVYIPRRRAYIGWDDANGDEIPQYAELGSVLWDSELNRHDPATGLNRVQFEPGYNASYLDEINLMFEKALTMNTLVSIAGFYKKKRNLTSDVNSEGEITGLSKGILPNGSIETKDNWEQSGTVSVGGTEVPVYQRIIDPAGYYYYNPEKAYDRGLGLQFRIMKKLSNGWAANFSFTWQDWKRYRFEEETLDMTNFDFFNRGVVAPVTTVPGLRDLWVNACWNVNLTWMYHLPWDISLTGSFRAREGYLQPLRRYVVTNQGGVFFYTAGTKAGDERLPAFWELNLGLEKRFRISDRASVTLVIDWYNVANSQIPLKRNLAIGEDATGAPVPTMWTDPGIFQLGIRVDF